MRIDRRGFMATLLCCAAGVRARAAEPATGNDSLPFHRDTLDIIQRLYGTTAGVTTERLSFDLSGYESRHGRHYVQRSDRVPVGLHIGGFATGATVSLLCELSAGDYLDGGHCRPESPHHLDSQLIATLHSSRDIAAFRLTARTLAQNTANPCGATCIHLIALARDRERLVFRTLRLVSTLSCGTGT